MKKPDAHVSHSRSLLAVAAVLVKVPAAHTALTVAHVSPLSSVEYDVPATQAAHWRSAVAEPAAAWPWPTPQVRHAVQVSAAVVLPLTSALKVPDAQGAHVRSLLAVAAAVV